MCIRDRCRQLILHKKDNIKLAISTLEDNGDLPSMDAQKADYCMQEKEPKRIMDMQMQSRMQSGCVLSVHSYI